MNMYLSRYLVLFLFAVVWISLASAGPIEHGRGKLIAELNAHGIDNDRIEVQIDERLGVESFHLGVSNDVIRVMGGDEVGAMYGLLDAADQLRLKGGGLDCIAVRDQSPRFPFRAVKFNLPWSAYRDHAVVRPHMDTCRDLAFWEAYLDMMAENRFNRLTLWNLHPFPYMFRPSHFPEACGLSDKELAEWQVFWRSLFAMANERGIKTYIVWWNIFVSPEFSRAHDNVSEYSQGLQFYGEGEHNALVDRYNRECVTQLINEYPGLDGIGISLGERMLHIDENAREQWILDVVVEGLRAADRQVEFIHRAPFTPHAEITRRGIESMSDWKKPIWVEFKFNASHGHSAVKLAATHGGPVNTAYWDPPPQNYKMTWMMRNEDFVMLRWGQPDFIRAHIAENGQDYVGGYYVGSETYIPAVEYMQLDAQVTWDHAYERDWLFYKMWGHLLYDPATQDAPFEAEYIHRYGKQYGPALFKAITTASKTPLLICSYLRGGNDPSLTAEHLISTQVAKHKTTKSVFIDVNQFITWPVLDPDVINIKDYVRLLKEQKPIPEDIVTPLEVAGRAREIYEQTLANLKEIPPVEGGKNLEVSDAMAWALLAKYFGLKVQAAVALESYREMGAEGEQRKAIALLEQALEVWMDLSSLTEAVYNEVESAKLIWIEKPRLLSWKAFVEDAEYDVTIARDNVQTMEK